MSPSLTCHSDGASRGNPGPAGAGVIVADESGRERRAVSVYLGEVTNNVAEYLALQEALKAAAAVCREDSLDESRTTVSVRTDSQLIAKQVTGEYKVKSEDLQPLKQAFRDLARRFYHVEVVYVPREKNERADRLANEAIDRATRALGTAGPAGSPRPGACPGSGPAVRAAVGTEPGLFTTATAEPTAKTAAYSRFTDLECSRCGRRYDPAERLGPCPACDGPLLARYDLEGLVWPPEQPAARPGPSPGLALAGRRPEHNSMWRYHELLPVTSPQYVVSLGEGMTPLVSLPGVEREIGLARVFAKDEGMNPTATFKARGASAAVSRSVELGIDRCALPTAGNAGAAFAAYTARAGIEFLTAMPEDTPETIAAECQGYGATVVAVPGLLPDAARYVRERAGEGWFVASTFDEPYRVEGKKTIALEIFEAFGSRWPDAIVFPVGGGVGLIGAWKAATELAAAGVATKFPKLFAVQAASCSPVAKAFSEGGEETEPFPNARTVAVGLRVPAPKAGFLMLKALRVTGGAAVAVPDEEILRVADKLRRTEGVNFCPEGAAAVAALPEIARRGWFEDCREVVVVNTGSGLIYGGR